MRLSMQMRKAVAAVTVAILASAATGCGSGLSMYTPRALAQHELTLHYDNEVQIWSPTGLVAHGVRYQGLADYVHCVPDAHRHALEAESTGSSAFGMTVAGGALAVVGLGGLAGLAYQDKPETMGAIFMAGISTEVVALVLAAVGRGKKPIANGHAVDAVNFYNDYAGVEGVGCGPR